MQYTVRNVSNEVDAALRQRAKREGKSMNRLLLDLLQRALGLEAEPQVRRDLSDVAGKCTIDDTTRAALQEQRRIDPEIWEQD